MPHIICFLLKLDIKVWVWTRCVLRVYQLELIIAAKILHNSLRIEAHTLRVFKCSGALVAILLDLLLHLLFHLDAHLLTMIDAHLDNLQRTLNQTRLH